MKYSVRGWVPGVPGAKKSNLTRALRANVTRLMATRLLSLALPTTNHQFSSLRAGYLGKILQQTMSGTQWCGSGEALR